MIKLINLINENSTSKYEFGCVMLYFTFNELKSLQSKIEKEDIYEEEGDKTYGLEDEPHCTLLYGLHEEVKNEDIKDILEKFTYYPSLAYNVSIFESEKYDVLKFDISGKNIKPTNKALRELPHTTEHLNYHPHLTIGYLQKGKGKEYIEKFKGLKYELIPKYGVYSHPDGIKSKIKIKVEND